MNRENLVNYFELLFKFALWSSLIGVFLFITDFGFIKSFKSEQLVLKYYYFVLIVGLVSTVTKFFYKFQDLKKSTLIFDSLTIFLTLTILWNRFVNGYHFAFFDFLKYDLIVKFAVVFTFLREFTDLKLNYKRKIINPAQLFVLSFFLLIVFGALLLALPKATYNGISFIDAIFTSTSAVCVTGLIVVDTATYFTPLGQYIILFLIQLGGLGILTFASYFAYFFRGTSTYENQLALSDMNQSNKLSEVFSTIKYILIITFSIEFFAALFVFFSFEKNMFPTFYDRAFFSIFHSISAFCNAGFSNYTLGLYDDRFRFNYPLQFTLMMSFVFGGLGFSIVSNVLSYIKYRILAFIGNARNQRNYRPWVLNINSRITLITTILISTFAFIVYFSLEYHNTLSEHSFIGKIVTAMFTATTPRTAGFNSVDLTLLSYPTLVIMLFLMWVGASPASTGGGIKTSTIAIAVLNVYSLIIGKNRIEIYRREISENTVQRAFATIILSFFVIGLGISLISVFDPKIPLLKIAFECFSAYSTVGLSLGVTPILSIGSKWVLIILMFIGRVSMLSIMIAVFKKIKHKNYRYPKEEITIN